MKENAKSNIQLGTALKDIRAFRIALEVIPKNYKVVRRMIDDELDNALRRKEAAFQRILHQQAKLKARYL